MAKYKIIPSSRTIVHSPISIGHKAEKGVEAIEFDLTAWVETYGSGTLTVIMRRWGDAIPYPIALEIDENNKATWTLSDIDTAKAGMAYAQLNYIVGDEVVKKSDIYTFRVMDSLTGEGDPPEAYESWLEHLTHFAAEAMAEVLDIEGIVTDKTLTVDGGIADGKATGDALALKADKSTTYTKTEVDQMIEDVEVETDTTLEVAGAPADAAETGRQIGLLRADLVCVDDDLKDLIADQFVKSTPDNYFPQITLTSGYYIDNGVVKESTAFGYSSKVPVERNTQYTIELVPVYGSATRPWFSARHGINFFDDNDNWISEVTPTTTGTFTTPLSAKYMIVNVNTGSGISLGVVNSRCMMVKGNASPSTYVAGGTVEYYDYPQLISGILDRLDGIDSEIEENYETLDEKIHWTSLNLYDASFQTDQTISPHYFYNGVPYSSTQYDNGFHCVDFIEVKPSTQYIIGYVPDLSGVVKPWGGASQGLFFYDSTKTFISNTPDNIFTTPSNCKYIRFNWALANGTTLDVLNSRCMLVKGSTLPETYSAYGNYYVKEKVELLEDEIERKKASPNIKYIIEDSGNSVTLISKYSSTDDIAICLKKKGGNNLFDFYSVGLIPNSNKDIADTTAGISYIISSSGDWFSPFVVKAKSNVDGDNPTSERFTGGNHQYNNESYGSTATARTSKLILLADNMTVSSGFGKCQRFEMVWTNLVQGYNTTKENGTGREILQEDHRLIFDGVKFEAFVDLIPLEDVIMNIWYGFQWFNAQYPNTRYIGGANRGLYDASEAASRSGDVTCCHVLSYSTNNEIRIDVDSAYDLGDHKYYNDADGKAIFTATYGKGYFFIIKDTELDEDNLYSLHGYYQFKKHQ